MKRYLARKSEPLRLKGSTIPFRLTVFYSMMWKWLLNLEIEFNKIQHITTNYADQNSVISNIFKIKDVRDILNISQVDANVGCW